VDGRDKPGHDVEVCDCSSFFRRRIRSSWSSRAGLRERIYLEEPGDCRVVDLVESNGALGPSAMIRKLTSRKYRLYSRKPNPKTGKRRNLGTFNSRAAAEQHERAVQYFKRH
jgi:hypothetical protein